jgi:CDP-diacylglycerol--serine O-phosphatidyltransferase
MAGSLLADVLDGAIARKMGIGGGLGVQLDSLADMVTFGVLPAMMIFYCGARFGGGSPGQQTIAICASLSAVSAGLRLGRFNVDVRPREYFWGLATPAGGMLVASWLLAQHTGQDYGFGVADMPWLGVIIPLFLVVAFQVPLKLPGLKSPKSGVITAALLAAATITGLVFFGPIAVTFGIIVYVLLGVVNLLLRWY